MVDGQSFLPVCLAKGWRSFLNGFATLSTSDSFLLALTRAFSHTSILYYYYYIICVTRSIFVLITNALCRILVDPNGHVDHAHPNNAATERYDTHGGNALASEAAVHNQERRQQPAAAANSHKMNKSSPLYFRGSAAVVSPIFSFICSIIIKPAETGFTRREASRRFPKAAAKTTLGRFNRKLNVAARAELEILSLRTERDARKAKLKWH